MAEVLVFEFDGVTEDDYNAVNDVLGVEGGTGQGDFPPGLTKHIAGQSSTGLLVCEVWESREAQGDFMQTRLGPALGKLGLPEPKRVEWLSLVGMFPQG